MDRDELENLLAANLPAVRAFVRLRTSAAIRARESRSDLVQSVCREGLETADQIEHRSDAAFRGWLFTAALRKLVARDRAMHTLKRARHREVSADAAEASNAALFDAYATVTTPSAVVSAREQVQRLEQAFEELSEAHREVITLAKIAGLSHQEIAAQLQITEEASRQLLRRAMIRLTRILDPGDAASS
ncbi:MAG: sigma-70 family RNA polymerase sigma factor [Planctomycetes bacterium]|nr:sigma-70 family RNA polymerase sigma factor [Planctomycetota bacterium]